MRFDTLLHADLERFGRRLPMTLRMPTVRDTFWLFLPRKLRTADRMAVLAPAEIKRLLHDIEGQEVDIAAARSLYADRQAFAQYAEARNRLLETAIEDGTLYARCPYCERWDADLKPLAVAVGLRSPFWPVSEDDLHLAAPSLGAASPRAPRPPMPELSSRLRIALPYAAETSGREFSAIFRRGDTSNRHRDLLRNAQSRANESGHEQWREDVIGFRAAVCLAANLESLGDRTQVEIDDVMDLNLGDFMCLDNFFYLLHSRPVPEDQSLVVQCGDCGRPFLPLL